MISLLPLAAEGFGLNLNLFETNLINLQLLSLAFISFFQISLEAF